jgi:hypothetical protein
MSVEKRNLEFYVTEKKLENMSKRGDTGGIME